MISLGFLSERVGLIAVQTTPPGAAPEICAKCYYSSQPGYGYYSLPPGVCCPPPGP
jgi:hypothetical protein